MIIDRKIKFSVFICLFFYLGGWGQTHITLHPRGLIKKENVSELRKQIHSGVKQEMYRELLTFVDRSLNETQVVDSTNIYDLAYLCTDLAGAYLLSENDIYAEKAYTIASQLAEFPFLKDPFSRGLTRAMVLQQLAITYDFCYEIWSEEQREQINQAVFEGMFSVNANMGYSANYNLASNWMGVRYGSVILAASVWDDPLVSADKRSRTFPILWDASKRLKDHIDANLYSNGWNGESLGYHVYNWSFIGPALIALKHRHHMDNDQILKNFAPKALYSLQAQCISNVAIESRQGIGLKPDLSDDNLNGGPLSLLSFGFQLYPDSQRPALKWMYDYLSNGSVKVNYRNTLLHGLLYYPASLESVNPYVLGWVKYHDPEQGIIILRNKFQDHRDIIFALSATARRVRGHKGPDTNTFRLIGLGVPWIVGGGRTSETAGQSNFFPSEEETILKGVHELGNMIKYRFGRDKQVEAITQGNGLGTQNHKRYTWASMDTSLGAQCVIIMADSSSNGRRFRINTPEFNQLTELEDGYILTAPNGSTMRVSVLSATHPVKITEKMVRYGGSTQRLNPGIGFNGKSYAYTRAIDLYCKNTITVAITLQERGKVHPEIQWKEDKGEFLIHTTTTRLFK